LTSRRRAGLRTSCNRAVDGNSTAYRWDPAALSEAASALALAAFVAAIVPASRAAVLAPMKALRIE
jgi:hypothetical protein